MNSRANAVLLAAAVVAALSASAGWYDTHQALNACRFQFVVDAMEPMAQLLKDNHAILAELQAEPYVEQDNGILESYLVKIRRDGVAKHADMKQRLDQLAENNSALVTLITTYSPHAKTAGFSSEANKFRNYAAAWRDRWNSVMELFMAGGNYPAAAVPFPKDFPAAVHAEIVAAR